jgi:hypothetical protein
MAAHDNITKKSVDLHEPLLKRDEDSSDDDEDSMYSSSTQSKVKTTPLQKLKSLMGKFPYTFYVSVECVRVD